MTTKAAILHCIRRKCVDCSGGELREVRLCPVTACELWPYRFGRDPSPCGERGFAGRAVATMPATPMAGPMDAVIANGTSRVPEEA